MHYTQISLSVYARKNLELKLFTKRRLLCSGVWLMKGSNCKLGDCKNSRQMIRNRNLSCVTNSACCSKKWTTLFIFHESVIIWDQILSEFSFVYFTFRAEDVFSFLSFPYIMPVNWFLSDKNESFKSVYVRLTRTVPVCPYASDFVWVLMSRRIHGPTQQRKLGACPESTTALSRRVLTSLAKCDLTDDAT